MRASRGLPRPFDRARALQSRPHAQPDVLVWDRKRTRGRRVLASVTRTGFDGAELVDPAQLPRSRKSPPPLLTGLAKPHPLQDEERAILESAGRVGCPVIAYSDGLDRLPLREKCSLLVCGARFLLDSAHPDFESSLAGRLRSLIRSNREEAAELLRARALMESLGVVGESRQLENVFLTITRIASLSDLSVLISGETGTGKELAARALHFADPKRRDGPFLPVNCAAIPAGLMESELFGHRRGAFTGASSARRGLFRAAESGVVFLDEIGEMDLGLQAKLLRVLQERAVSGVGEDRGTRVDVRVIAATNCDLAALVERGAFRRDLYHRLCVLQVAIPPLRDRPVDVGPLVRHYVRKHQALSGRPVPDIRPELIEALQRLPMVGNVRQLEAIVRQMLVAKADSSSLDVSDLPARLWRQLASGPARDGDETDQVSRTAEDVLAELAAREGDLGQCLEWCERTILERTLRQAHGNRTETARALGVSPRTVYNKIRKHRLPT